MTFDELISIILELKKNSECKSIKLNSKFIEKNDIFISISEDSKKNLEYVSDAISKGAQLIISSDKDQKNKNSLIKYFPNIKNKLGEISNIFYEEPSKNFKVFGVTGTNGKSSVSYFLHQIFTKNNFRSALLSSVKNKKKDIFFSELTTPDTFFLNQFISNLSVENYKSVILEVSSHAIHQKRVEGLDFNFGCFTNISRDHLDYHKSMKEYSRVKESFFLDNAFESCLINVDTSLGKKIKNINSNFFSFSSKQKNVDFFFDEKSVLHHDQKTYNLKNYSSSNFMQINLAMALSLALISKLKINLKNVKNVLSPLGRFEKIEVIKGKYCVIDYAHTPIALETILSEVNSSHYGDVISIFGCGGDRDKGKRAKMGEIAEKYSNELIITNDNPRWEDPLKIKKDIMKGLKKLSQANFIYDREEAIKKGFYLLKSAKKDSVLIIAGKGHEDFQEIEGKKYPFSDKKIIQKLRNVIR